MTMVAYGLTPEGFVLKPLDVIINDFLGPLRARFGAAQPFDATTTEGQIITIFANALAELWELLQQIVAGMDPDQATGILLAALCALTGTFKKDPQSSTVVETLTGDPATIVFAKSQVRSGTTPAAPVFATVSDTPLLALDAWAATTGYALGARVTNSGRCYVCTVAGTSAGSGGPTTTDAAITDGGATWRYMGQGTCAGDAQVYCAVTGPTVALSGDLTAIVTPVSGWQSAINLLDATPGRGEMTDSDLRVFREQELASAGNGTADAVRAAILKIEDVTACTVFVNDTDETNDDGMPPHSIQALVTGGADQSIWDTLWQKAGAGPYVYGDQVGTTPDSTGKLQTERFSRPESVPIYVRAFLTVFEGPATDSDPAYPSDGDDEAIAAIVDFGNTRPVGRDSVPRQLGAQTLDVDGVIDPTEVLVWTAPISASPAAWTALHLYSTADQVTNDGRQYVCTSGGTSAASGGPSTTGTAITDGGAVWRYLGAPIVITSRQQATYDTSRTAIVTTGGTP